MLPMPVRTADLSFLSPPRRTRKDMERDLGGNAVKSARRVLEILEFFEQVRRPACVSEIVSACGIPQSSASMLLQTLYRMGYVRWDSRSRTYALDLRLHMLGGWVHDSLLPRGNLRGAMLQLAHATGLSVVLGRPDGMYVMYSHVEYGSGDRQGAVPVGAVRPILSTGLGITLLSASDDEHLGRIAATALARGEAAAALRTVDDVFALKRKVRELGYAYSIRFQNPGRASLSFLLRLPRGQHGSQDAVIGLALAGRQRTFEEQSPRLLGSALEATANFLPEVRLDFVDSDRLIPL